MFSSFFKKEVEPTEGGTYPNSYKIRKYSHSVSYLTPLMRLILSKFDEEKIQKFEELLENGADINFQTPGGDTCLFWCDNTTWVEFLIKKGANINIKNNDGNTPLIEYAQQGDFDIFKILLENGADLSAINNRGKNAELRALDLTRRSTKSSYALILDYITYYKIKKQIKNFKSEMALEEINLLFSNNK